MELLDASPFNIGDRIAVEDQTLDPSETAIDPFKASPLRIVNSELFFDDQKCSVNGSPVKNTYTAKWKSPLIP